MIRLARFGAPKQPYYRIVVIEKDRARNGRSIEVVGTYNPRTEPATIDLKHERIAYWRSVGAQMSPRVEKLVAKNPGARSRNSRSLIFWLPPLTTRAGFPEPARILFADGGGGAN
jgi:small subunit ribosomal protein S16